MPLPGKTNVKHVFKKNNNEHITSSKSDDYSVLCMHSYYMLVLWFPELMNRFRWYETLYSGAKNKTTMCEIVSIFKIEPEKTDVVCNDHIDQSVYINIIIIGIACIPTSIFVPLFVNKFGLRFFLGLNIFIRILKIILTISKLFNYIYIIFI